MPDKLTTWRVLDVVMSLLLAIVTALLSWNLKTTYSHGMKLSEIDGNRFTAGDGLEVWKEISAIRTELAMLPREVPPQWFIDDVGDLKRALESLDQRVRGIERKMPK